MKAALGVLAVYGSLFAFFLFGGESRPWPVWFIAGAVFAFFVLHLFREQLSR